MLLKATTRINKGRMMRASRMMRAMRRQRQISP
jgi:hypothetical protein